jgi:hypothetical protein
MFQEVKGAWNSHYHVCYNQGKLPPVYRVCRSVSRTILAHLIKRLQLLRSRQTHISGPSDVIRAHENALLEDLESIVNGWCQPHRSLRAFCRSNMSVRIQFDRPQVHFTNLDFLTGKVIVHLVTDAAVSAVTVKLEGESRTRLSGPKLAYNNERSDKRRTELEWHKVSECHLCYAEGHRLADMS